MQCRLVLGLFLCMMSARSFAGDRVIVVADLLEAFPTASVTNCLSCELRAPGVAGGVKQDALFEHPAAPGTPARVEYRVALPGNEGNDQLVLGFEVALADGVKPASGEDGVTFKVAVNEREVFSVHTKQTRWEPQGVDLTS